MSQQKHASCNFSIEHILPIAKGGSNELENLALSCQGCNNIKHMKQVGIDPETEKKAKLYHPGKDKWTDHFEWNENFTVIIGRTPTGRATIIELRLNRNFLINQRTVYRSYGAHPPKHSLSES